MRLVGTELGLPFQFSDQQQARSKPVTAKEMEGPPGVPAPYPPLTDYQDFGIDDPFSSMRSLPILPDPDQSQDGTVLRSQSLPSDPVYLQPTGDDLLGFDPLADGTDLGTPIAVDADLFTGLEYLPADMLGEISNVSAAVVEAEGEKEDAAPRNFSSEGMADPHGSLAGSAARRDNTSKQASNNTSGKEASTVDANCLPDSTPGPGKLSLGATVSQGCRKRPRNTGDAGPSTSCHMCATSEQRRIVHACANNRQGLCRKIVCDVCLSKHEERYQQLETEGWDEWICHHCRDVCPPADSRCFQYARNNANRPKKNEKAQVTSKASATSLPTSTRNAALPGLAAATYKPLSPMSAGLNIGTGNPPLHHAGSSGTLAGHARPAEATGKPVPSTTRHAGPAEDTVMPVCSTARHLGLAEDAIKPARSTLIRSRIGNGQTPHHHAGNAGSIAGNGTGGTTPQDRVGLGLLARACNGTLPPREVSPKGVECDGSSAVYLPSPANVPEIVLLPSLFSMGL